MNSIEMQIGSQRFILKGEDDEPHLQEVAEMVRRKVEALRKKNPTLNLQRASMLASFDLASQLIKGRRKALEYRSEVVAQTSQLLDQVEGELASTP